jgi:hypothetical protein
LDNITHSAFLPDNYYAWNGTWLNDHEFFFIDPDRGLVVVDLDHRNATSFLTPGHLGHFADARQFWLSADKQFLMVHGRYTPVYRRSSVGEYSILPLKNNRVAMTKIQLKPYTDTVQEPYFPIRYPRHVIWLL